MARIPAVAMRSPLSPPAMAMIRDSATIDMKSDEPLAPRAVRTASSRRRVEIRARRSVDRLAHATPRQEDHRCQQQEQHRAYTPDEFIA